MIDYNFKYRSELQKLEEEQGISLPLLHIPESKQAFRYVFSNKPEKNHLPAYIQKPQRAISDADKSRLSTSGFALSCFEDEDKAVNRYDELKASYPKIMNTIGDALSFGVLNESDGLITDANDDTHFDLYESHHAHYQKHFKLRNHSYEYYQRIRYKIRFQQAYKGCRPDIFRWSAIISLHE